MHACALTLQKARDEDECFLPFNGTGFGPKLKICGGVGTSKQQSSFAPQLASMAQGELTGHTKQILSGGNRTARAEGQGHTPAP